MARLLSLGFIAALAVFAALVAIGGVRAEDLPSVRVVGTDPPLGRNLSRNWPLYVHLRYQSDVPLRVQVKGFLDGAEVTDGVSWNPSPAYPAGSGEAIAWIAFSKPARIDELRVEVSDASWQNLTVVRVPHNAAWTAMASERPKSPEWVARLSDAQQRGTQESHEELSEGPIGMLLGMMLIVSVPGYFVLQTLLALIWRGRWRIAALAPLLIMVPATLHANLSPFNEINNLESGIVTRPPFRPPV